MAFQTASSLVNKTTPTAVAANDLQGNKLYIKGDGTVWKSPKAGAKLLQVQRVYTYQANDPGTLADDLIQVTVKINWPGSTGRSVTMGTSLSRELN